MESENFDSSYYGVVNDEYFAIEDEQIPILKEKVINMLDDKEQQLLYDRYTLKKTIPVIAKKQKTTENNIYQKLFRLTSITLTTLTIGLLVYTLGTSSNDVFNSDIKYLYWVLGFCLLGNTIYSFYYFIKHIKLNIILFLKKE